MCRNPKIKMYTLGFMFNIICKDVLLIRKNKPEWQRGYLNGVGGKLEEFDPTPVAGMVREFMEETGIKTVKVQWQHACTMSGRNWKCYVFRTWGDIMQCKQETDEELYIINVNHIGMNKTLSNLQWLVPLLASNVRILQPLEILYPENSNA